MKQDISNREDIDLLVNSFYRKVVDDDTIGYIFNNLEGFSFETHMPIMISFWETLLLGVVSYKGNPMIKHVELNKLMPLKDRHFNRWLALWEETVNEHFEGRHATEAVFKARNIANLMQVKIHQTDSGVGGIQIDRE